MNEHLAYQALADLMPFVLEDYFPDCATPGFKRAVENAKKVLGAAPVKELDGCCPLVLYFGNESDRSEFVQLVQLAKPGMETLRL